MSSPIHVVGGVYRERCVHPRWNEIYGSAGRAALAIAALGTPVALHSYVDQDALDIFSEKGIWLDDFSLRPTLIPKCVGFDYLYDMAVPSIVNLPSTPYPSLKVNEEKVVRFGMLEGDAVISALWAVYDPQNVGSAIAFGANGSTAEHLALVLNAFEAANMAGMPGADPIQCAQTLAEQHGAEVVVIKMGPEGALVWSAGSATQVPAYRTGRVWKIGSGDCFVAHFANAWMHEGQSPSDAAHIASKATSFYCETQGFATRSELASMPLEPVELSDAYREGTRRRVYLAGPFFDLAQVWMVHQARANLQEMGLNVFSPYHDIGLGSAEDVVEKDLDGIRQSDLMLALTDGLDAGTIYEIGYARALGKPVIVYSERHKDESLKMMEGSGCTICTDYTTALYSTLWEAVKL